VLYNSQVRQDTFVDKLLNKDEGFFLDIGAGTGGLVPQHAGDFSNTYFFEHYRGWNGIAIDYDRAWYDVVKDARPDTVYCEDLLEVNINDFLESIGCQENIDYISLDVDDAQWKVFNEFDWSKYRFKVLTLEHNLYQSLDSCEFTRNSPDYMKKIDSEYHRYRKILKQHGYKILWGNVELNGYGPIEDWWVSEDIYEKHHQIKKENINCNEVINITFE
tara:strand:+ start:100 stop:753 length:654 start_codon:yes stop_codon:yes gene_type:complete